jgi:hypothetical protein
VKPIRRHVGGGAERWTLRVGSRLSRSLTTVLVAAVVAVLVFVVADSLGAGSADSGHSAYSSIVVPQGSVPLSHAAPNTVLLTCKQANWGQLPTDWRSQSLVVGSSWLVYARQLRYASYGQRTFSNASAPASLGLQPLIVEVNYGSTTILKVASQSRSFFRFVSGFNAAQAYNLPNGDVGFTLVGCPRTFPPGPNGNVTDFSIGYFMASKDRAATVEATDAPSGRTRTVYFR